MHGLDGCPGGNHVKSDEHSPPMSALDTPFPHDLERAKLEEAVRGAGRRYGFVRAEVQDALLNVDPDMPLPASEMERR